jgi:hypothetical protein
MPRKRPKHLKAQEQPIKIGSHSQFTFDLCTKQYQCKLCGEGYDLRKFDNTIKYGEDVLKVSDSKEIKLFRKQHLNC